MTVMIVETIESTIRYSTKRHHKPAADRAFDCAIEIDDLELVIHAGTTAAMAYDFFDLKMTAGASEQPYQRLVVNRVAAAVEKHGCKRHERNHDGCCFGLSPVDFREPEYGGADDKKKNARNAIDKDDAIHPIHEAKPHEGEASNSSGGDGKYAKHFRDGSCLHRAQKARTRKNDKPY